MRPELVGLVEGLALRTPALSMATITRRAGQAAAEHGWAAPSYATVRAIVGGLDMSMVTLAHDGPAVFRDRFELVYRRRATHPNDVWQADHTELDLVVLGPAGVPVRPWLTMILDDRSRAVAGYTVFLGAPSALNLLLALRQAIWVKTDPRWMVHGIPGVLHVDHGSDFTSHHLAQVAADLHLQVIYSAVARPQGRGKLERLFGTITTELLPELSGHLRPRAALHPALADPGRARHGDRHLGPHRLPPTPPHRDRGAAAAGVGRERVATPHSGLAHRAGPAARPGRRSPGGPPRRHPLPRAALPAHHPRRAGRAPGDHPLRPPRHHHDPGLHP